MLLAGCSHAHAAYHCSMTVQRVNLLTLASGATAVTQSLTLACSRAASDPNVLSYRIAADNGVNAQGQARNVRLGNTSNLLSYRLNRGTAAGQAAACNSSGTIWRDNGGGLVTGVLSFGALLNASTTWSYCTVANASSPLPAGEYTDQVQVTLRYPNTGAGQLLTVPLNLQFGVQTACLIDKPIGSLSVNYTSFQTAAATATVPVLLRCSSNTPWAVGLLGPTAPGALPVTPLENQGLLGLSYSLQVTPSSGTGLGNGNNGQQTVTIGLTVPGGQGGSCTTGSCTGSATHTLVVTY